MGCGKSTLLRLVIGLDTDFSGDILFDGVVRRASVAMAFQEPRLLPWRTVRGNLQLVQDGAHRRDKIEGLLELVDLGDFSEALPKALSGGMAQRVSLARALVNEPEVLLLDEPFSALDAMTRMRLQEALVTIHTRKPRTTLLVTHDIDEALFTSDRVVVPRSAPAASWTTSMSRSPIRATAPIPSCWPSRPASCSGSAMQRPLAQECPPRHRRGSASRIGRDSAHQRRAGHRTHPRHHQHKEHTAMVIADPTRIDQSTIRRRGTGLRAIDRRKVSPGLTLIAPLTGNGEVYLVDLDGEVVHEWRMPYPPGLCAYLLPNGNLLYGGRTPESPERFPMWSLFKGGAILEVDWDGKVLWEVRHPDHHHDARLLRNGNIIMLAIDEVPAHLVPKVRGGQPGTEVDGGRMFADALYEVTKAGDVVWEWHAWHTSIRPSTSSRRRTSATSGRTATPSRSSPTATCS